LILYCFFSISAAVRLQDRSFSTSGSSSSAPQRPISPHVQIYDFPVPALSSITNRVTGAALTVGLYSMGYVALAGSCDIPSYVQAFQSSAPFLVPVAKAAVGFPLIYHTGAGIRHLYWDYTAKDLDLLAVEKSSKLLIGASGALALIAAFINI
jgi:succinate dehydrogenase (ubiquinone) cytochrome b560 subunit